MIKPVLLVTYLFIVSLTKAQSPDTFLVSNEAIRTFFKEFRRDTLQGQILLHDEPKETPTRSLLERVTTKDTFLSKADISFIEKQGFQREKTVWSSKLIDSTTFLRASQHDSIFAHGADSGWKIFYKTFKSSFYKMSVPVFSLDKRTCIINISHYCGAVCGEGSIRVYRREKNGWKLYKSYFRWTS